MKFDHAIKTTRTAAGLAAVITLLLASLGAASIVHGDWYGWVIAVIGYLFFAACRTLMDEVEKLKEASKDEKS